MRALALCSCVFAALALAACGNDGEQVNALSGTGAAAPDGGATSTASSSTGGGGPQMPKRTVLQRNPFGDVAETQNLLWDGDFEWYTAFADEYGWLDALNPDTFNFDYVIVGPDCRSGVKCASVPMDDTIVGIAVASQGNELEASFWAKPAKGDCSGVEAAVESSVFFVAESQDPAAAVKPSSKSPDQDGWCHFDTVIPARTEKPVLFIDNQSTGAVVVDDCVLKVAPAGKHGSREAPSARLEARAEHFRKELARWKGPHDRPPNAARRALEAWKAKR